MRQRLAAGIICAALFFTGCSSDKGASVEMTGAQRFDPTEITVSVGETIEFSNTSSEPHTVTAYADEIPEGADYFASGGATSEDEARENLSEGLIDPGETFEVTPTEPGTYEYFCIPHERQGMTGTIEVVEGTSSDGD